MSSLTLFTDIISSSPQLYKVSGKISISKQRLRVTKELAKGHTGVK